MVSLLDNGSSFRKVAPNTRSSEKARIIGRDRVPGCMANAVPRGQKRPLLYPSPPGVTLVKCGPVCHPEPLPPGTGPLPRGKSYAFSLWRPRYLPTRRDETGVRPGHRRAARARGERWCPCRHATGWMYGPIPTSSGWMATAAQKLWSPRSWVARSSPMLVLASRDPGVC